MTRLPSTAFAVMRTTSVNVIIAATGDESAAPIHSLPLVSDHYLGASYGVNISIIRATNIVFLA